MCGSKVLHWNSRLLLSPESGKFILIEFMHTSRRVKKVHILSTDRAGTDFSTLPRAIRRNPRASAPTADGRAIRRQRSNGGEGGSWEEEGLVRAQKRVQRAKAPFRVFSVLGGKGQDKQTQKDKSEREL